MRSAKVVITEPRKCVVQPRHIDTSRGYLLLGHDPMANEAAAALVGLAQSNGGWDPVSLEQVDQYCREQGLAIKSATVKSLMTDARVKWNGTVGSIETTGATVVDPEGRLHFTMSFVLDAVRAAPSAELYEAAA
ncbi:MAG: hypothetical protein COT81_04900 [Candidatus Buchananbacteria bacterium CG10_big_fil_rev_8_21_14_0_10_42_9]|uniref:Uncharacterized protein n=1 Tax=Candidatus Buchananbacteria bacterium CG10_big_fil_rev_8_21_14_0_10_42_9 TaxID=1974526 RepID=A0A2H0W053_9BACT|nr:MAG: hypothetical protein COT81_04900 [Candidatus Buchananbacteria bacterium CG10_big_fil_rev_8_21_14_0_10_42_9]